MDSSELRDRFRLDVHDVNKPYLWSDDEAFEFMDDAQKMFCRLAWGIADSTSAMTRISCPASSVFVKYDPRITKIKFVQRLSDFQEVHVINIEDIQNGVLPTRQDISMWQTGPIRLDNTTGAIQYVVTGMEANKMRLCYIPSADDTLQMTVYRMPLNTIDGEGANLEIDEQHHIHLLKWMKARAYGKQDAETYDQTRHDAFQADFKMYCEQAKEERGRREHKPRLMAYGGI